MKPKVITIDLETTTLDPWHTQIHLIAYRYDGHGEVKLIKLYNHENPNDEFLANLADPEICKRGHNAHFDLLCLSAAGYVVRGDIDDTRILSYLENPSQELDLKGLVERKLKRKVTRLEDFGISRLKKENKNDPQWLRTGTKWVKKDALEPYNQSDVINCDDLRRELITTKWYKEVEQPLSKIIFDTELRGIQLDIPYLKELENEFDEKCKKILAVLGTDFNPRSPNQVKKKFQEKGSNLDTTDKHTLKLLSWKGDEFARNLLEYRRISKLLSTYISPFIKTCDATGRLHGRFNQAGRESLSHGDVKGTATGRLSSSEPNLQNIPDRTEEGRKVRKAFIATPGYTLIDADLKQIQPRLIAHYTQSYKLLDAYSKGLDTHAIMGAGIFNKKPEELSKTERFIGKTGWLQTFFGSYPKRIKLQVETNSDDPIFYSLEFYQKVFESFWQANPELVSWKEQFLNEARAVGGVTTFGGRFIKIEALHSHNKWERQDAERLAVNYLIQGSEADIVKIITVQVNKYWSGRQLAWVHDEVLGETPRGCDDVVQCTHLKLLMEDAVSLKNVQIIADTKIIKSWADK